MKILENKIGCTILLASGIVFFACGSGSEREFVIQNLCKKQIKFPETVDVSYKGFKIASAKLLNSNGDYMVMDNNEIVPNDVDVKKLDFFIDPPVR